MRKPNYEATSAGRSHRTWVELKAWAKENLPWICHLCGQPIDRTLHYNDRMAWTLDHVQSKERFPDLVHVKSNVAPAHRACNSSKGQRDVFVDMVRALDPRDLPGLGPARLTGRHRRPPAHRAVKPT